MMFSTTARAIASTLSSARVKLTSSSKRMQTPTSPLQRLIRRTALAPDFSCRSEILYLLLSLIAAHNKQRFAHIRINNFLESLNFLESETRPRPSPKELLMKRAISRNLRVLTRTKVCSSNGTLCHRSRRYGLVAWALNCVKLKFEVHH